MSGHTGAGAEADWDLSTWFDAFGSASYRAFRTALEEDLSELERTGAALGPLAEDVATWRTWLHTLEDWSARSSHLGSYLGCLGAADSRNDAVAAGRRGRCAAPRARREAVHAHPHRARRRFGRRVRRTDRRSGARPRPLLSSAACAQRRASGCPPSSRTWPRTSASSGFSAWGTSSTIRSRGGSSSISSFPASPRSAFRCRRRGACSATRARPCGAPRSRGANEAWEAEADVLAACLNGIAGTRLELYRRRGVGHYPRPPRCSMRASTAVRSTRCSLAVRERADLARRYLRAKARALGLPRLGFQDLEAPLPTAAEAPVTTWTDARAPRAARVRRVPRTARRAPPSRAFAARWIDHSPRGGKRPGGFLLDVGLGGRVADLHDFRRERRATSRRSPTSSATPYHGAVMKDQRPWARR